MDRAGQGKLDEQRAPNDSLHRLDRIRKNDLGQDIDIGSDGIRF